MQDFLHFVLAPQPTAEAADMHAIAPEALPSQEGPRGGLRPQKSSPFPLPQRVTNCLCGKGEELEMHSVVESLTL